MRSDVAAGVVTLKGKVSNRYIAMSTTGSLYTTVSVAAASRIRTWKGGGGTPCNGLYREVPFSGFRYIKG